MSFLEGGNRKKLPQYLRRCMSETTVSACNRGDNLNASNSQPSQNTRPSFESLWSEDSGKRKQQTTLPKIESAPNSIAGNGKPDFWDLWSSGTGQRKTSTSDVDKKRKLEPSTITSGKRSRPCSSAVDSSSSSSVYKAKKSSFFIADPTEPDATKTEKKPAEPRKAEKTSVAGCKGQLDNDGFLRPVAKFRVRRSEKPKYAVVSNVKEVHQCVESGEGEDVTADLIFRLGGLTPNHSVRSRCLSLISLAQKCSVPVYRMHIRANDLLKEIFSVLYNCQWESRSYRLCAGGLLFFMCLDRQSHMSMDGKMLAVVIELIRGSSTAAEPDGLYSDLKTKIKRLLADYLSKSLTRVHFELDQVDASQLAFEALLNLGCTKCPGDWFRDALRTLRGFDVVNDRINQCFLAVEPMLANVGKLSPADQTQLKSNLQLLGSCLKMLEVFTFSNFANQQYLIDLADQRLPRQLFSLLPALNSAFLAEYGRLFGDSSASEVLCSDDYEEAGGVLWPLADGLSRLLRVLVNLLHCNRDCQAIVAEHGSSLFVTTLEAVVVTVPRYPYTHRFELAILLLLSIINSTENARHVQDILAKCKLPSSLAALAKSQYETEVPTATALLCCYFAENLQSAHELDQCADGLGQDDSQPSQSSLSQADSQQSVNAVENLTNILGKIDRHMDVSFLSSYTAIILSMLLRSDGHHQLSAQLKRVWQSRPLAQEFPDLFQALLSSLVKLKTFLELADKTQTSFIDILNQLIHFLDK